MTDKLLPCPFCCKHLEDNPAFSTRSQKHFTHPALEENETSCILEHVAVVVSDREHDQERIAAWNRRDFSPMSIAAGVVVELMNQAPAPRLRWIEWNGGDFLPVPPEMRVTVLLRDGSTEGPAPAREFGGDESCWKHRGAAGDIVAYTSDLLSVAPPQVKENAS